MKLLRYLYFLTWLYMPLACVHYVCVNQFGRSDERNEFREAFEKALSLVSASPGEATKKEEAKGE